MRGGPRGTRGRARSTSPLAHPAQRTRRNASAVVPCAPQELGQCMRRLPQRQRGVGLDVAGHRPGCTSRCASTAPCLRARGASRVAPTPHHLAHVPPEAAVASHTERVACAQPAPTASARHGLTGPAAQPSHVFTSSVHIISRGSSRRRRVGSWSPSWSAPDAPNSTCPAWSSRHVPCTPSTRVRLRARCACDDADVRAHVRRRSRIQQRGLRGYRRPDFATQPRLR